MLISLTKTAAAAALAAGLALAGLVVSPADAAMRTGGGGFHGGGGGFHGGGGGFHGGGGGFHGGGGGFRVGGGGFHGGGGGFHGGGRRFAGGGYGGYGGGYGGYGGYGGGYGGYGYGDGYGYGNDYGYGGVALGLGLLGGAIIGSQYPYYDSGYADGARYDGYVQNGGANSSAYCASRFKSYNPASGTYLGYDGVQHPCP